MKLWRKLASLAVLAGFTTAYAQSAACTDLVQQALATVQTACASTGRNQACYGNVSLTATPRDGVQGFAFSKQGDLANVADLASLQLQQLDVKKQLWGVALMKLQASLPDTLPGQNVTFLLFGDVKITNAVTAGGATATPSSKEGTPLRPMQAFYFSTGIAKPGCAAAPDSGILIQTPKGAGKISLRANNVDIQLGSTAFLRAQPAKKMTVSVVEGEGQLTADGKTVTVPAGTEAQVPMDENLQANGAPDDPQPYVEADVADLPVELMPIDVEIAPPDETYAGDETDVNPVDNSDANGNDSSLSEDTSSLDDTTQGQGDGVASDNSLEFNNTDTSQSQGDTSSSDGSSQDSGSDAGSSDSGGGG